MGGFARKRPTRTASRRGWEGVSRSTLDGVQTRRLGVRAHLDAVRVHLDAVRAHPDGVQAAVGSLRARAVLARRPGQRRGSWPGRTLDGVQTRRPRRARAPGSASRCGRLAGQQRIFDGVQARSASAGARYSGRPGYNTHPPSRSTHSALPTGLPRPPDRPPRRARWPRPPRWRTVPRPGWTSARPGADAVARTTRFGHPGVGRRRADRLQAVCDLPGRVRVSVHHVDALGPRRRPCVRCPRVGVCDGVLTCACAGQLCGTQHCVDLRGFTTSFRALPHMQRGSEPAYSTPASRLRSSIRNTGLLDERPPSRLPTGGSVCSHRKSARLPRSHKTSTPPPATSDAGRSVRASGPNSRRSACGTTSPTNPMSPVTLTIAPTTHEHARNVRRFERAHVDAEVHRPFVSQREQVEAPGVAQQDDRARRERRS